MALAFVSELLGLQDNKRVEILGATHPAYTLFQPHATVLVDAYDGSGGFLNGAYLWRYPREKEDEYGDRQKQARYHNYVETLVDLYVRKVFAQGVKRTTTNPELEAWWEDVDGSGTTLDTFMRQVAAIGLAAGYLGVLVDKTPETANGPSRADEKGRVFLSRYTPNAMLDWRYQRDTLTAIKLLEQETPESIVAPRPDDDALKRYLIWTEDGWARFQHDKGTLVSQDEPGLGVVPFDVFHPKRSARYAFVGKSLCGNANVIKALYNRASEEDEVLRDQAFSLLVITLPPDANVQEAKNLLGQEIGTTRALFVKGTADFRTADMGVPKAIRENQDYLVKEIYRMAHMRFTRDSLDAESGDSIRMQHDELNDMLQGVAAECTRIEQAIARYWFHWMRATTEQAEAEYQAAEVTAEYPREFFLKDLEVELKAWADAIAFELGDTFTKRIKKRVVRRVDPDIPQQELKVIDQEIEAQPAPLTEDEKLQQRQETMRAALQGRPPVKADGDDPVVAAA